MLTISTIVQLTIFVAFCCAVGGLISGLSLQREDVDIDFMTILAWLGNLVALICALILIFDSSLTMIGYEVVGLCLSLGALAGFLGIGLFIGPSRR